ncbi:MAG: hypothetical protein C0467_21610 [Planctomycetaceae bacterium]|nr:hypothetical protein [Planctomycetaceae bacterium]
MTRPELTNSDRREEIVQLLLAAPGIDRYPDVFPCLSDRHLRYLADHRTPRSVAAGLLTAAGRQGPADQTVAAQMYMERGELSALRMVADPELVARAASELQRDVDQRLGQVEAQAVLCDREGICCPSELTWGKRVQRLREGVSGPYAESPVSQKALIASCRAEMDASLEGEKQRLKDRLATQREELERNREILEEEIVRRVQEYADSAQKLIESDDLVIALRKLAAMESLLSGRVVQAIEPGGQRLPLPTRRNPLGRDGFHFENLLAVLRQGAAQINRRGLGVYFRDKDAIDEAVDSTGFLVRHATRRFDWAAYFSALRDWLGLSETRTTRRRRLQRLDTPNLDARGASMPGRWLFLTVEPWQGAPFYEDISGRPRIIAIVRPAVTDAERNRPQMILKLVSQTLGQLLNVQSAETDDERRFRQDGLVIVLLPGETLSGKKYDQFRLQVQLEKQARWSGRVAYIDDLDLLRLLPQHADDRLRALLELALPRFPDALSQTYQESDAVRPRMFFGRSNELAVLTNGSTVVFSGRKMGKSSLLHRLRAQCGPDTDQRAILVGCSGIATGRSWMLLPEIERELAALLTRESFGKQALPPLSRYGPVENFSAALDAAKDRFRGTLDEVMQQLAGKVQRLYVLLDEADNFIRAEMEETSGGREPRSAVSWFLRDLQTGAYSGRLRFIFAGYDQIGRVFRDPGLGHSAFGNWGAGGPLKLGPLDESAARSLVLNPLTALGMLVGDDLAERILDYTSGHASLIQAFCRKLAERIREKPQTLWPLNDVAVEFEDVQAVADDQRGAGDQSYRQLLEQTLGLNLDIARAYPLKLLFLALVSPNGRGAGRILGSDPFTVDDTLEQVRPVGTESLLDLTPTLVLDSLDLLAQLGLLEDVSETAGRSFRFRARHYVNVLRTNNGFRSQLQQAVEEWQRTGRKSIPVEPRYVWTLPDSTLRMLRDPTPRPAVVVGLPGTGRTYLAEVLAAPRADYGPPALLTREQADMMSRLDAFLASPPRHPVIVSDPADQIPWETVAEVFQRAQEVGLPLRWVGGPQLAWNLAGNLDTAVLIDGPFGLGPLTASELEPWTARELGGSGPPSAANITESDRVKLLESTGGLLPVLEMFRRWLMKTHGHFPDAIPGVEAERFHNHLDRTPNATAKAAERLAEGIPGELRTALQHLFADVREWGAEVVPRAELTTVCPHLDGLGEDGVARLLDAAGWLSLLPDSAVPGQVAIPHGSILGLLIRHPRFAST